MPLLINTPTFTNTSCQPDPSFCQRNNSKIHETFQTHKIFQLFSLDYCRLHTTSIYLGTYNTYSLTLRANAHTRARTHTLFIYIYTHIHTHTHTYIHTHTHSPCSYMRVLPLAGEEEWLANHFLIQNPWRLSVIPVLHQPYDNEHYREVSFQLQTPTAKSPHKKHAVRVRPNYLPIAFLGFREQRGPREVLGSVKSR